MANADHPTAPRVAAARATKKCRLYYDGFDHMPEDCDECVALMLAAADAVPEAGLVALRDRLAESHYTAYVRGAGMTPAWPQQSEATKDHWRKPADEFLALLAPQLAAARRTAWGEAKGIAQSHADNDGYTDIERHIAQRIAIALAAREGV